MTAFVALRVVLFWAGLVLAGVNLACKAYDAGRRCDLARVRGILVRRRAAR